MRIFTCVSTGNLQLFIMAIWWYLIFIYLLFMLPILLNFSLILRHSHFTFYSLWPFLANSFHSQKNILSSISQLAIEHGNKSKPFWLQELNYHEISLNNFSFQSKAQSDIHCMYNESLISSTYWINNKIFFPGKKIVLIRLRNHAIFVCICQCISCHFKSIVIHWNIRLFTKVPIRVKK